MNDLGAVRLTIPTLLVLHALIDLDAAAKPTYGLPLCTKTGQAGGVVYKILQRLAKRGWLTTEWEKDGEVGPGRPRRRYYQFTPAGVAAARDVLYTKRTVLQKLI
jgi:DNA-binding PadR family transcriptional regulator